MTGRQAGVICGVSRGEDTKRNLKHAKRLRGASIAHSDNNYDPPHLGNGPKTLALSGYPANEHVPENSIWNAGSLLYFLGLRPENVTSSLSPCRASSSRLTCSIVPLSLRCRTV